MFKRFAALLIVGLLAAGLVAGCGGGSPLKKGFGDVLHDKAAAKKAYEEMKAKGGTPLMIFQNVNFSSDFINFSRQDQKKKENVDNFTWNESQGWTGPTAAKLRGDGKLEDNLFNADEVNWEAIPDFVAQVEKEAKTQGIEKAKVSGIMVMFNVRSQKLYFSATVKGERKDASADGDVKTGKMTSFKVR